MDKFKSLFRSIFPVLFVLALTGFFVVGVYAASTIGTNMVTTGTMHIGDGSAQTKFEVQGTASSSYILTGNTIQVGGFASAAYNRLGTTATTHDHYIAASNDLFISGDLEGRGSLSFTGPASISLALWVGTNGKTGNVGIGTSSPVSLLDVNTKFNVLSGGNVGVNTTTPQTKFEVQGTASASYFLTGNTIQVGGFASAAYNRFGTTATTHDHYIAGSGDVFVSGDLEVRATVSFAGAASFSQAFWIGTNGKTGNVGVGTNSPTTKFEVSGSASVSTNFEVGGVASAATLISKTSLLASSGRSASSSTIYVAEFGTAKTATVSVLFGGNSASQGTCLQLKDTAGSWVYARVNVGGTAFVVNTNECHTGL